MECMDMSGVYGCKNQKLDTPATAQCFGLKALNTTPKCQR